MYLCCSLAVSQWISRSARPGERSPRYTRAPTSSSAGWWAGIVPPRWVQSQTRRPADSGDDNADHAVQAGPQERLSDCGSWEARAARSRGAWQTEQPAGDQRTDTCHGTGNAQDQASPGPMPFPRTPVQVWYRPGQSYTRLPPVTCPRAALRSGSATSAGRHTAPACTGRMITTPALDRIPSCRDDPAPPAVQSAPHVGAGGQDLVTARGTGAAQTVWSEATSPSPTD
jgi:hypothetical protein